MEKIRYGLRLLICWLRGHRPQPLPCSDKRWSIFYCQRCKQMVADLTPMGAKEIAGSDLALQEALGEGLAQAMMDSIDRLMREMFVEAANRPVEVRSD